MAMISLSAARRAIPTKTPNRTARGMVRANSRGSEKPISLRMLGTYHQFGQFVSDVAALSRVVILTMHDISLKPVAPGSSELALVGEVRTYRYVDDSDAGGGG